MAGRGSAVWVDGMDRLYANMNRVIKEVEKASEKGLQKAGMQIIADAQRNMRTAGHNGGTLNSTGRLSQSGKVQKAEDGGIDAGFFSKESGNGYAAYVEYGTKAHYPPHWSMRAWVRKKLRVAEKDADKAAYAVSRSIAKKGTRPHPFFAPAVKKNSKAVEKALTDAINEVTERSI